MPLKQSDKCPYQSIFSPGVWVHLGQYLSEKCCANAAKKEYKELPLQFWKIKKWADFLKFQLLNASKLRTKYRDDAILAAFNDKRCRTVYSLNAPWFIEVVEEYQAKEPKIVEKQEVIEIERSSEPQALRPSSGGNSLASLLD